MSVESPAQGSPAPALPPPSVPTLPAPSIATAISTVPSAQPGAFPPVVAPTAPNWKPIQGSRRRKLVNGIIGLAVLAALAVGARFVYESLAPAEDTTTPTTVLRDNPDSVFGKARDAVRLTNDQMQEDEVQDLLGGENPAAPASPTTAP